MCMHACLSFKHKCTSNILYLGRELFSSSLELRRKPFYLVFVVLRLESRLSTCRQIAVPLGHTLAHFFLILTLKVLVKWYLTGEQNCARSLFISDHDGKSVSKRHWKGNH